MSFLIDTNVVSELRRRRPSPAVRQWFQKVPATDLFVSALLIGEIRRGIELLRRKDRAQAAGHEAWLGQLQQEFADRILPVTAEIADEWGRLNSPNPLSVIDGLLAATAIVHGLTLVTRNTADVARTGVVTHNPFEASP